MNKLKRLLASVLSVVIIFSIPLESFAAIESDGNQSVFSQDEEITEEEKSLFENDENIAIDELATDYSSVALNNDDVSVTGTDSLGRLLGEAFSDKASEQIENSGYNIFSVEIEGNTAVVEFETLQDAILVVAVYEEDGIRLLGTGKSPVLADSESVNITIDVDLMPKYFYIRSFLILSDSLEPLCPMYESAKYTQEMQEFLAMTTDDFDKSLVMNLDEDKNNNFLIYKENVVRIDESDVVNVLVSADEEALQYVFDKIDDQISGLKPGDILSYEKKDGMSEIIIVESIDLSEDGAKAIIKGGDGSAEDVFDYIKINSESDEDDITLDASGLEEGVTYKGELPSDEVSDLTCDSLGTESDEIENLGARSGDFWFDRTNSFDIDVSYKTAKLSGSVGLNFKGTVEYYVSLRHQYVSFKLDYKITAAISASGKVVKKIPLGFFGISPIPGIIIEFTPSVIFEAEAKISLTYTLSGSVGRAYDSKTKWKNLTTKPKTKSVIQGEIKVFIGISLEPRMVIISKQVAHAGLTAQTGVEITGKLNNDNISSDSIHMCQQCVSGEITWKSEVTFTIQFLNLEWLKATAKFTADKKIGDWHYSRDYNEFKFEKCSHRAYPVTFTVRNLAGDPIPAAEIKSDDGYVLNDDFGVRSVTSWYTDQKGKMSCYQIVGTHTVIVRADKYKDKEYTYSVVNGMNSKLIVLDGKGSEEDPTDPANPENPKDDIVLPEAGAMGVSTSSNHTGILLADGSLWTCGRNYTGELGNGDEPNYETNYPTPRKIMSDVKSVNMGFSGGSAIKNDDSLWVWGRYTEKYENDWISGVTSLVPIKFMDNVKAVEYGIGDGAAIKNDGSMWVWGSVFAGATMVGSTPAVYTDTITEPVKVLDDVREISLGWDTFAAIKNDDSLWMWGYNNYGQLGTGDTEYSVEPIKVMDNVRHVSLGYDCSSVVKNDGSLWMWGKSSFNSIVEGDDNDVLSPVKIMDDVLISSIGYNGACAAIKTDKSLWVWGTVGFRLKDKDGRSTNLCKSPIKILDDVAVISMNSSQGNTAAAIQSDGTLWMWGSNYYGQCGDGNTLPIKIIEYIYEGYAPNQEPVSEEDDYEYDDEYSDYSMSDIYMLDQCFSYSDDSLASLGADDSTASFSNLEPYTDYIFYLLRERETEDPLSAENVLYITQETSDGDGRLSIMYIPREMVSDAEGFVVKQWEYVESEIEDGDLGDESEVPDGLWLAGLETLVYDGTKQLQDIRVYDGKTLLTEKTDYTLSYKNNKNAYTLKPADAGFDSKKAPQLTVVMKGNYSGSQTIYFNIDPLSIEGVAFDGIQKKKGKILYPVLLWNGRALKEKTDYTVNGGQITGKGNFSGTRDVLSDESETVTMSKVKIGKIDALTYKGSAYTTEDMKDILEDKLTYNGVALVNGSDYMISKIINGKNIGAMTIVVQGLKNKESKIGPLSGEKRINIKIAPYNLSGNDISVTDKYGSDDITTEHKKGGAKPTIKVLFNGNVLKQGRDYTIAYTNNKTTVGNIKKPTIIVSGKGNYTGKRTVEFVISQKPFTEEAGIRVLASDIVMSKNTKKYQTKIQVFDSDGVLLKPGQDYDKNIVYKRGNVALDKNSTVDIGDEITVEITGSGKDYSSDTITATYRVLPANTDISKAAIKIKDQSYTGHEIKITGTSQILSASIGKSKTALNISVDGGKTGDFIVVPGSYTNNVQKGTAKVTLKGINGYGGYKTVSFKIGTRSILEWWKGLFG